MNLTAVRTLGRSGLIVSPIALGIMTFGTPRWGNIVASMFSVLGVPTTGQSRSHPPRHPRCPTQILDD